MTHHNKTTRRERQKLRDVAAGFFGPDRAARWLRHSEETLDGARPVDLMRTRTGAARVENLLDIMSWRRAGG
jgi:uncharacterized protein (DUF2384 family)